MPGVDKGITHSLPETNQSRLNVLEALLRWAKEKPCPYWGPDADHRECGGCDGTGTITDPKLQAAWELLVEIGPSPYIGAQIYTKTVAGWPDSAVRGLLEQVVETIGNREMADQLDKASGGQTTDYEWDMKGNLLWFRWQSKDLPGFFQAIKEALNEQL